MTVWDVHGRCRPIGKQAPEQILKIDPQKYAVIELTQVHITRKSEAAPVNGIPEKRMFWSIISDYDLRTGLCELIDNALDLWILGGQKSSLTIAIVLDVDRQVISV